MKYSGAVYTIKVELMDHMGLYTEKFFDFDLTLNNTWYEEWKRDKSVVDDAMIINGNAASAVGKIEFISVFGEVDLKMNSSS